MKQKALSLLLAVAMIISLLPMGVLAEIGDGYGQCPHHTEHTEECGFEGGGTCTYICDICLARVEELMASLPTWEELKQMSQDEKYEVMDLVDEIDRAKLNLSDAARELIDWTNYDAACVVLFMPEGFFGATISKGYLKSDYMPTPQFAFVDEHGERAQVLYSDLQTMSELLNVDENGNSEVFYLPEGTYTIEEIVDGEWNVSMEVDGVEAEGLTFTAAAGELIGIAVQNGAMDYGTYNVYNSDGTLYNEYYLFDDAFAALKSIDGGEMQYDKDIKSDVTVDSGAFTLKALRGAGGMSYFRGNLTASGSADITVLYGAHYGNITLKSGATLTIEDGEFYGDITVESGATLNINAGGFYGTVTAQNGDDINIASSVEIADFKTDTGKNIVLETKALSGYDSENGYDYIYYGSYNSNPIKWRVLDTAYNYDKTDASKTGMLLLAKHALDELKFGTDNVWNTSAAKTWCANMFASSFSTDEQTYVLQTNSDEILSDDTLFLLSYEDVCNNSYFPNGYTLNAIYDLAEVGTWLLRTPCDDDDEQIYSVYKDAPVASYANSNKAVRPAFNLDASKILFTSAAVGGKNTDNVGTLSKNGANTTGEYKLTMIDESRSFVVYDTALSGGKGEKVRVGISGAIRKENEYISAIITGDDAEVLYYGQVIDLAQGWGGELASFGFTIPSDIDYGTYEVKFFNEHINGDYETDISSNFTTCTLEVEKADPEFSTEPREMTGLTYNGDYQALAISGEADGGTIMYSLDENEDYSENIPERKDAGDYTVWYYIKGDDDHSDSAKNSFTVSIEPKDITNASIELGEALTYNGQEQTQSVAKVEIGGLTLTANEYSVSDNVQKDADTYTLKVTAKGNFKGEATKKFTVAKQTVAKPTVQSKAYTGGELEADVPQSDLYTVNQAPQTEKGTYDVVLTLTDAKNYQWEDGQEADTVVKFIITEGGNEWLTTPSVDGWIYSQKASEPSFKAKFGTVKVEYKKANEADSLYTSEPPTNAGDYNARFSVEATQNYGSLSEIVDFTIEKLSVEKPAKDTTVYTYNGQEQTYKLAESPFYTVSGNTRTDAGSQQAVAQLNDKQNYIWSDGSAEDAVYDFVIAPAESETTIGADEAVTYGESITLTALVGLSKAKAARDEVEFYVDDDAEPLGSAAVENGKAELTIDTTQKRLEIGENVITAQYGGSVNLNGSGSDSIKVTLNPKEVSLTWSGNEERTYDASASDVKATVSKIGNDEVSATVENANNVNADTYTADVSGLKGKDAKYYVLPQNTQCEYTILPVKVQGEWTLPADLTYNAAAKELSARVKNAVGEEAPALTLKENIKTDAGNYTAEITAVNDKNYTLAGGTDLSVAWSIEAKDIANANIELGEALTYNGQEQTQSVAKVEIDGLTLTADEYSVSDNVQNYADTYTLKVTAKGNFKGEATKKFTVAKAKITPEIVLAAPIKNGTPQRTVKADTYTATVAWLPEVAENKSFAKRTEYTAIITIVPNENYTVEGIAEFDLDGAQSVAIKEIKDNTATVMAVFPKTAGSISSGGTSTSSATYYSVKFVSNGGSGVERQSIEKNHSAKEPVAPTKDDYIFVGWYTDEALTEKYDFSAKVTGDITLYAKWTQSDNGVNKEWKNPFGDVKESDRFYEAVKYVNENGLMNGIGDTEFAPNEALTRAMLVTILYCAQGEPAVNKSIAFGDVRIDAYYANAVTWAQQNGIVKGISETEFAPEENVTREQMAAIVFRYAKFKGYDVSVGEDTNILSYTDFDEIAEYAIEALQYAVGSGLMQGRSESTINPKEDATRAEAATALHRLMEDNK